MLLKCDNAQSKCMYLWSISSDKYLSWFWFLVCYSWNVLWRLHICLTTCVTSVAHVHRPAPWLLRSKLNVSSVDESRWITRGTLMLTLLLSPPPLCQVGQWISVEHNSHISFELFSCLKPACTTSLLPSRDRRRHRQSAAPALRWAWQCCWGCNFLLLSQNQVCNLRQLLFVYFVVTGNQPSWKSPVIGRCNWPGLAHDRLIALFKSSVPALWTKWSFRFKELPRAWLHRRINSPRK